eukprot:7520364-Lingulodinium_polyedra.AAC.1
MLGAPAPAGAGGIVDPALATPPAPPAAAFPAPPAGVAPPTAHRAPPRHELCWLRRPGVRGQPER